MDRCEYRNCRKELSKERRRGTKYCNSSCKRMESTYVSRFKKMLKTWYHKEMEIVDSIKKLKESVLKDIQK